MSWDDRKAFKQAMDEYGESTAEFDGIQRSVGSIGRTFINTGTNISVSSEYNRSDYDYYRKNESTDKTDEGMMGMSELAYKKVAIVRNVIDMMSDFTAHGIRITHPNRQIENFCKNWAKTVKMYHVTERAANVLYRLGNCPIKTKYGKVPVRIEKEWKKNYADDRNDRKDDIAVNKKSKIEKRRIPLAYNILNPLTLHVIGGELSAFVGKPVYALKISSKFRMMIQRMKRLSVSSKHVADMLHVIPDRLLEGVEGGHSVVPLDQEKLTMLHYKKDDWNIWATPFLGSIMDNLVMLEKMHLADMSALDGAISNIRLWRLGSLDTVVPILPKPAAIQRLRNILASVGTGTLDLVWGPELDFKESDSKVHNYLKSEKYSQVMSEIFSGLGVPPSLTGGGGGANGGQGFTNNVLSMKTLIERLEYGRTVIMDFWNEQLKILQKAMGWRFPPKISFDFKVLTDEATEKKMILDLWDRKIYSTETVRELCRRDPEMETLRINREERKMENGTMPEKAGPYYNAQTDFEYKKLILQGGGVAPSELGIELEEKKEGENSIMDRQEEMNMKVEQKRGEMSPTPTGSPTSKKPKSPGGDGRPKNSTDTKPRKKRVDKPKTLGVFADLFMWGNEAQKSLATILSPAILSHYNKKSLRSLTKSEVDYAENLKFNVFATLEPYSDINHKTVYDILEQNTKANEDMIQTCEALAILFTKRTGNQPTLDETRQMQSSAYALLYEEVLND